MNVAQGSPVKKGKLKQFNSDYDDLDPVITYRHLQSSTIGPKHPLRIVALVDCNAFYANCEQVRLGIDPETPLVVLQWGMLIAVNYPARKYGISRMDKLYDARKRCPDLVVVHVATYAQGEDEPKYWENPDVKTHKISLDLYRRESTKVHNMLKELLPTGEVEKASIDEAFIDFSVPVRDTILKRYPYLAELPADASNGLDSPLPPPPRISFAGLGNLIPVDPSKLDPEKEVTTDLVEEIEKDGPVTWHDIGLAIAAELMGRMRKEIHEALGYLTSAGIARNKFLAKLAASYRKFNTQNILRNSAIPGFLKPMPFQKIRFLGGKLGKALASEYDVSTVGDLLNVTIDEMQSKFGECAVWVYEILRGIDRSEVKDKAVINKSMNASKNLPKPLAKPAEGPHWIRMLAAELTIRLNEAREKTPGLWPRTLTLHVSRGWGFSRSKQRPFPPPRSTMSVDVLTSAAEKLWKEIMDIMWDGKTDLKLTHISLGLTGIGWTEEGQGDIQRFLLAKRPGSSEQTGSILARPVNSIREEVRKRKRSCSPAMNEEEIFTVDGIDDSKKDSCSFTCSRCGKTIYVPEHLRRHSTQSDSSTTLLDESLEEARLEVLNGFRLEHDDYHFAQDLASQDSNVRSRFSMQKRQSSALSTKKRKQPEGIAKFLVKKAKS